MKRGLIFILILLIGISFISAEDLYCCEKTIDGAWCQNTIETNCNSNFRKAPVSCSSTSYCISGVCTKEGICTENIPHVLCENDGGVWENKVSCSEEIIKEQVKCVFTNSDSTQKCYTSTNDSRFECSGIGTCIVDVSGEKDTKLTWKSSCGGYAYTVIDGGSEYAEFKCGAIYEPMYRFYDSDLSPQPLPENLMVADVWTNKEPSEYSLGEKGTFWAKIIGVEGGPFLPEENHEVIFTFVSDTVQDSSGGWKLLIPYAPMKYNNDVGYYMATAKIPEDISNEDLRHLKILIDVGVYDSVDPPTDEKMVRFVGSFSPKKLLDEECISKGSLTDEQVSCINDIVKKEELSSQILQYCDADYFNTLPQYKLCTEKQLSYVSYICILKRFPEIKPSLIDCIGGEISPTNETGPIDIPEEEKEEKEFYICSGCELENKCYPFGYRKKDIFCSDSFGFVEQLNEDAECDNHFECRSNVCVSDKCVSATLIQKIINWFKRLFGAG